MNLSKLIGNSDRVHFPAIPSLNTLESACRRVLQRWPDVVAAPEQDRETIANLMLKRVQQDHWDGAKLAEVIRAGRVVFEPEFRDRTKFEEVREFYIQEARMSTNPAFLGAIMSIYLATFEPDARHTQSLASSLNHAQAGLGGRWALLLKKLPFLLRFREAATYLARQMITMGDPWSGLKEKGFQNPHAPGLLYHAHLQFVSQMRSSLNRSQEIRRVLAWLSPEGVSSLNSGAKEAVEALLYPWLHSGPNDSRRDLLREGLVSAYGDPRVRNRGVWSDVRDDYKRVLFRWLTRADIHFFLDVVTEAEVSHMWAERREFWTSLYEDGWVDAAWVAFSRTAESEVKRRVERGDSSASLAYGRQIGPRRSTSLLILQIGKCVVVEGSHSYMVHVFRDVDRNAPVLFRETYDCDRIRQVPKLGEQVHHSGWERKVRDLLEQWRN